MNPFDRIAKNPEKYAVYASEVMLKRHESDSVTLWLDGDYDVNPFSKGREAPEEPDNGTRYIMLAIEVGDDNMPINTGMRDKFIDVTKEVFKPKTSSAKVIQRAALICKDRDFQRYVYTQLKKLLQNKDAVIEFSLKTAIPLHLATQGIKSMSEEANAEEFCKYYIYYVCEITSRRQLSFYKDKKALFDKMLHEYDQWRAVYMNKVSGQ